MPMCGVMTPSLLTLALLIATLGAGGFPGSAGRAVQTVQSPATCEEAVTRLAGFVNASSESGTTPKGDPYTSARRTSADGEWFGEGVTIYRSQSRFDQSVRLLNEDVASVINRSPVLDEKGHQIAQRMVKEVRANGKVTRVQIWVIADRTIKGIDAPSMALALAVEKAHSTCRKE